MSLCAAQSYTAKGFLSKTIPAEVTSIAPTHINSSRIALTGRPRPYVLTNSSKLAGLPNNSRDFGRPRNKNLESLRQPLSTLFNTLSREVALDLALDLELSRPEICAREIPVTAEIREMLTRPPGPDCLLTERWIDTSRTSVVNSIASRPQSNARSNKPSKSLLISFLADT